jgi:selenocysteine lyase/cysteine desulfurase
MSHRRVFIKNTACMAGLLTGSSFFKPSLAAEKGVDNEQFRHISPSVLATNEDFWTAIKNAYTVNPDIINLNNGGVSPAPRVVQEAVERYHRFSHGAPSYYMWRILDKGREPLRQKLADLAGCDAEEIAINRNATEALNTVIYGLDFSAGDEVIGTRQDYPNMIQAWKQRAERNGIVYKQLSFDFPVEDDEIIVSAFENAITPATKLIHVTHIINWVGQIMPVRKISDMAHRYGIKVLCDGAHSFGLLDVKIPDLGCDYFGTSLHKFLSAPIGTGMLWIRKEHIGNVWPLLCNDKPHDTNIRKFETLGTRSFAIEQGIGEAISFHNEVGPARKEARIRYLKNYWMEKVQALPRIRLHTSLKDNYSCAIGGVSIDGMKPADLDAALFSQYKIHAVGIEWENIRCVRITPHVYTSLAELDKLVSALKNIAAT